MKERIVIEKEVLERLIKALPIQWFDNKGKDKLVIFGKEYQTEKEPMTWEELKELCKGRDKIRIANVEGTESIILNDNLICDKYGTVFVDFSEHTYCFAQNRTIPQLWAFIKSLIGEE